ncbi:MAG: hypothetical protein H6739_27160 [Alphaproteobacteria bacterium]|nr:hypothetical protein [Alphaproteobacteria bacterium]
MIHALGFSSTPFKPTNPGRLCRGRERWVQGWEEDQDPLWRLVISGASFTDDSARDATRGLVCIGADIGAILSELFPGKTLVAFREEALLGELPDYVDPEADEDAWQAPRQGGRWYDACQRWRAVVSDPAELSRLMTDDLVDGFLVMDEVELPLPEPLDDAVFLLTSRSDGTRFPVRRFQPLALRTVLEHCDAVICAHLDKHGPAIGVYTLDRLDRSALLTRIAEKDGILPVPFAIPPMLARWDRALQELRLKWMAEKDTEFPVPPAEEPTRWSRGRRRARRGGRSSSEE